MSTRLFTKAERREIRRLAGLAHERELSSAAAFDNHRAHAASLALDQLLRDEAMGWKERAERFRLQEWLLHEEMLQAAAAAARELRKHPARTNLKDVVKLLDLASILGRRACGMPLDPASAPEPEMPFGHPDAKAALEKIYGPGSSSNPAAVPEAVS